MAEGTATAPAKARTGGEARFYGVHHLALNTDDMKMTVDFYVGVLGMELVHAMKVPPGLGTGPGNRGNPPFENLRHYFFAMGRDALLAFFEMPKGAKGTGDRDAIAAMQHVAFAVSPATAEAIQARLAATGVAVQGPVESLPGVWSAYFFDPNGIRLEIAWQPADGEGEPGIVPGLTQSKSVALEELRTLTSDRDWLDWAVSALPDEGAH